MSQDSQGQQDQNSEKVIVIPGHSIYGPPNLPWEPIDREYLFPDEKKTVKDDQCGDRRRGNLYKAQRLS
jgi:hypothetical protein